MSSQNNKCKAQEENNMCRKLVVTNEILLGARPIRYEAYSLPKGEVGLFVAIQSVLDETKATFTTSNPEKKKLFTFSV